MCHWTQPASSGIYMCVSIYRWICLHLCVLGGCHCSVESNQRAFKMKNTFCHWVCMTGGPTHTRWINQKVKTITRATPHGATQHTRKRTQEICHKSLTLHTLINHIIHDLLKRCIFVWVWSYTVYVVCLILFQLPDFTLWWKEIQRSNREIGVMSFITVQRTL